MDLDTSQSTSSTEKAKKEVEEEASTPSKQIPAAPPISGGLATAELVFPLKSTTAITASLKHIYQFVALRPSPDIAASSQPAP